MAEKGGEGGIGKRPPDARAGGRNNEYPPDVDARLFKIRPLGRLRNTAADRRGEEGWRGLTISVKKFVQCNATHRLAHPPQPETILVGRRGSAPSPH